MNAEKILNFKENDFVIFQGHHNLIDRTKFDVILPATNWTEKTSLYLNCFGGIQKTKLITLPPVAVRDDWKITTMLTKSLLKTSSVSKKENSNILLTELHIQLNQLSGNLMYLINKYKIKDSQKLNLVQNNFTKKNIKLPIMPFKNFIANYYAITSVEKASKIMRKCSNEINLTKTNFIK